MNAMQWLDSKSPDGRLWLDVVAELIYVNGGTTEVRGWGAVRTGVGAYGRLGLTLPEALHLLQLYSLLQGILIGTDATDTMKEAVTVKIEARMRRADKELSQKILPPTPDDVRAVSVPEDLAREAVSKMVEKKSPGGILLG